MKLLAWPAAALLVTAAALLSLAVGTRAVPPSAVLDALLHGGSSPGALVVRSLRLPRTEVGLTAGAALGLAGAALQAVTRNPLADPGILGLSQGAAAGVVLAIALGLANGFSGYVWYAFAGAVVAACLVYAIAARGVRVDRVRLALTVLGVVLAATATGAAGPIGFVALTAPQLARRLTRTPQLPLLNSALAGAFVLVTADLVARTLLPPLEIPVGALTALVGGPYLLWLLGRDAREPGGTRRPS
ncbi:iron ABC transporter permease [Streptomyces sp. NBC_01485]|uniref:iron chelate uptake ABC transporter family permease subunit n=1 Tax=Streptomyces sp. NBC_01485 TaxID=2903884 RepID=UPI002E2EB8B0|nr:iron chelate uptake ABC transporter family permease subunit [Streptomyces sp. NBC_01485]